MIYIIGDSHTHRMRNSIDHGHVNTCSWETIKRKDEFVDIPINSNCDMFHVAKSKNITTEIYFSGHKGASGYSSSYTKQNFPCIKQTINENSIVMPFFGYIDVKAHLPHKKNTEEAVKKYVEQTLLFFKNNKVRFISPIPQFINALGSGSPNYEFEERFPYYEEYKYFLNKYVMQYGLKKPISIENILNTDRLDESFECHDCHDCLSPQFKNFKLDHLKKQFNLKILNEIKNIIMEEIK